MGTTWISPRCSRAGVQEMGNFGGREGDREVGSKTEGRLFHRVSTQAGWDIHRQAEQVKTVQFLDDQGVEPSEGLAQSRAQQCVDSHCETTQPGCDFCPALLIQFENLTAGLQKSRQVDLCIS